jgi:hypothetical protein
VLILEGEAKLLLARVSSAQCRLRRLARRWQSLRASSWSRSSSLSATGGRTHHVLLTICRAAAEQMTAVSAKHAQMEVCPHYVDRNTRSARYRARSSSSRQGAVQRR